MLLLLLLLLLLPVGSKSKNITDSVSHWSRDLSSGSRRHGGEGAAGAPARPGAGPENREEITVPHLRGIFLAVSSKTAQWSLAEWAGDLAAMKAVGIEFFCPRAAAVGQAHLGAPSSGCPLGHFTAFYPSANPCFHLQPGMPPAGAVATILQAAKQVG
eukprot:SAG31_NODE_10123_length_1180_cov_0.872340_1_plen_157_part_10